jgi:poly(3-hydroxybutyrate) depolymerase
VKFGGPLPKTIKPFTGDEDRPVSYAVSVWRKHNHCNRGKVTRRGNIERTDFQCRRGALRLIALDNEMHSWPGSLPGMLGTDKPSQEISATDELWEFWSKARKRRRERAASQNAARFESGRPAH